MRITLLACALMLCSLPCCSATMKDNRQMHDKTPITDREAAIKGNALGLICVKQGDLDCAEAEFLNAVQADPRYAAPRNNLGLVYLEKKKWYEAAIQFKTAIQNEPRTLEPRINLARLYELVDWKKDAIAEYEALLGVFPGNDVASVRLASLLCCTPLQTERCLAILRDLAKGPHESRGAQWAINELREREHPRFD